MVPSKGVTRYAETAPAAIPDKSKWEIASGESGLEWSDKNDRQLANDWKNSIEKGTSLHSVDTVPRYRPLNPSLLTTLYMLIRRPASDCFANCIWILTISIGFVAITWHNPANPPDSIPAYTESFWGDTPSRRAKKLRAESLIANFIAFSGVTPIRLADKPRYKPWRPSCLITDTKQCHLND